MARSRDVRNLLGEDPEAFLRQSLLEPLAVLHVLTEDELLGENPEPLHDFRVAIRTLRSRLKFFEPYFARQSQISKWLVELAWLDKQIQPLRDLDVQRAMLEGIALDTLQNLVSKPAKYQKYKMTVLALQAELADTSKTARAKAFKTLTSARKNRLLTAIKTGLLLEAVKPKRITALSADLNQKMQGCTQAIEKALSAKQLVGASYKKLHKLRLDCKKARYLAEAMGEESKLFVKAQTLLGEVNDLSILDAWLKARLFRRNGDRKVVMSLVLQTTSELEKSRSLIASLLV